MKSTFFAIGVLMISAVFCASANSQVIVNDVNINELEDVTICQVLAFEKFLSKKVVITINYGQELKFSEPTGSVIKDKKTGKNRKFNSTISAINYMEQNGWEFIDALSITVGTQNVYHYYFRKKESD